jgi:hypothetical protein
MDRVGTTCRTRRVKRHLDFGFRGTSRIPTGPSRCFQGFDRCPPPLLNLLLPSVNQVRVRLSPQNDNVYSAIRIECTRTPKTPSSWPFHPESTSWFLEPPGDSEGAATCD